MFNDTDIDIDERTEGSEWTIRFNEKNDLNEGLVLDLVKRRTYNNVWGPHQFEAVMYQNDEFVGTVWGYVEVPSVVTNINTFLQWGMYTLRREAAKRYINRLTPQEQEMVFNLMCEQVANLEKDFASHEYEV